MARPHRLLTSTAGLDACVCGVDFKTCRRVPPGCWLETRQETVGSLRGSQLMFKVLQTGSLVAAVVMTGLMAGLFASFAYAVMPGLAKVNDRAFIDSMQRMNVAIVNGW